MCVFGSILSVAGGGGGGGGQSKDVFFILCWVFNDNIVEQYLMHG